MFIYGELIEEGSFLCLLFTKGTSAISLRKEEYITYKIFLFFVVLYFFYA